MAFMAEESSNTLTKGLKIVLPPWSTSFESNVNMTVKTECYSRIPGNVNVSFADTEWLDAEGEIAISESCKLRESCPYLDGHIVGP